MKIYITVGTHRQQFNRLLKTMDEWAALNKTHEIFAQTGNSDYEPKNFKWKKFLSDSEYSEKMKNADIIATHAGAGTIITALNLGKALVIMPRLKKFLEHTNDHQAELAGAIEKEGLGIFAKDEKTFSDAMKKALSFKPKIRAGKEKTLKILEEFLIGVDKK